VQAAGRWLAALGGAAALVLAAGRWLAALGGAAALVLAAALLTPSWLAVPGALVLDLDGLYSLLLVLGGLACAGLHLRAPAGRDPSWPLALVILAVPLLAGRLQLLGHFQEPGPDAAVAATVRVQAAGLAVVGVVLLVLAVRSLGRLPTRLTPRRAPPAGAPPASPGRQAGASPGPAGRRRPPGRRSPR
jgi:hypothetical protein